MLMLMGVVDVRRLKLTSNSALESSSFSLGTCFGVENVECQVKNKKVVM